MGTVALWVMLAGYLFGGVMTVREWFWISNPRDLTANEIWTIVLIILLWPLAWAYWRASK